MYSHILHATDLLDDHYSMCQKAVEIAKHFKASLFILHVIVTPSSVQLAQGLGFVSIDNPETLRADAASVLHVLGEDLKIPSERQIVRVGSFYEETKDVLQRLDCGLLIVGKHHHHFLAREASYEVDILSIG